MEASKQASSKNMQVSKRVSESFPRSFPIPLHFHQFISSSIYLLFLLPHAGPSHSPTLIPNPSLPASNVSSEGDKGLADLTCLSPACGKFGKGAEGGGAGGPRPTTGIPRSRAGREVREFVFVLVVLMIPEEREGLSERIGGVKERVFLLLRAPAEAGGRGDGWADERAVVRIWMLKGRFVDVGCCWVGIMEREGGRATPRMGMGALGVC